MRIDYKYIYFYLYERKEKTSIWKCYNNKSNSLLGIVKWYGPWRSYCYFSELDIIYSSGCLGDIQNFISFLMNNRK